VREAAEGDVSDTFDHFQDALDNEPMYLDYGPDPALGVWKMRDGQRIRVRKMKDSHVKNTIAMLERKVLRAPDDAAAEWCEAWIETLRAEQVNRKANGDA
jgi:hypothetical protein